MIRAIALLLAFPLLLAGCPSAELPKRRPLSLVLEAERFDPGKPLPVPEQVQLRLRLRPLEGHDLLGALIDDQPGAHTRWFIEPEDAAEIDPKTAQLTVKKPGKIKVWATYEEGPEKLSSNALELTIAPATSASE